MTYKRIMVGVDGSEAADLALKEAIHITKDFNALLRVIHVVDENVVKFSDGFVDLESLWAAYQQESREFLSTLHTMLAFENIKFETDLVVLKLFEGHLAEKIIKEANGWKADLLVIGTHGRHGISRFFLGSVAERILRIANVPVLLVPRKK